MFTLQVQLTKAVYGKVTAAVMIRRFLYVYAIIGIIAIALVADLVMIPPQSIELSSFLFPILFVLFFVGYPLLQSRCAFGWKTYPTAAQPATYVLSAEGLNVQGENYHAFQAWENFLAVKQFKPAVVLFFTQNHIFILPNESFVGPDARRDIVDFIQSHIPLTSQRQLKFPTFKRFAIIAGVWIAIILFVFIALTVLK